MRAVVVSMKRALRQPGALRTAAALARSNQRHGFDYPGCAWPEEPGADAVVGQLDLGSELDDFELVGRDGNAKRAVAGWIDGRGVGEPILPPRFRSAS